MSFSLEKRDPSNSPERQYDETAVLVGGVEKALTGFAKDGGTWIHGKEVFEELLSQGARVDDALHESLDVARDGAESTSQEAAQRFWEALPTDEAISNALTGYANSEELWRLAKWTFEDLMEEGYPVDRAIAGALRVASDDSETTPTQATLRFWDTIQPEYVQRWLESPMNNVGDNIILGAVIHRPKDKIENAATFIGDQEGRAVIVKQGEKSILHHEYTVLNSVDHPGIPRVTSYGEDIEAIGGLTRLAVEQLPGTSLDNILSLNADWRHIPLRQDRALEIGLGVADNLKALSDAGYLYRDLHPGHVIVEEKGERISVGLVDVELCLQKDEEGTATVAFPRGTWEMMSPEEFEEGGVMSESSNVYSVACLILQMVSGNAAFRIPVEGDLPQMVAMSRIPHLEKPDIRVDGLLGQVLDRALEPDPANRYQTLDEFMQVLRGAL